MLGPGVTPGTEIGAYRVISRIGAGGMGEVWMAEHMALGRRAAIKVLHAQLSNRAEIVTRFFNEARAATAISDPGIVQIFDFGQCADGSAYIVMELLEGEPLDRRLLRMGSLPIADALRIMRQVATSLGAAHARGIVHRDLKPENMFLVRDVEVGGGERAKILDFGIAKLSGAHTNVKTQTAAMMGTPMYMSPEQCRGAGQVDQRADVYSLGCVLFTLVTGRPPFDADGAGEIIAMHLREPAPLASSVAPGIPSAIDEVIARCLEKNPDDRFASAVDLAQAIARIHPSGADGSQIAMPVARSASTMPTTLSSIAVSRQMEIAKPARRGIWLWGGVVVAVVGGAIGFGVVTSSSAESPESATSANDVAKPATLPPTPPPARKVVDQHALTAERIHDALERFVAWSKNHAGAACPTATEVDDAWRRAMTFTCTEQPSDQIVGVISAGPDGAFGTDDDVRSWELGRDATAIVKGMRWLPMEVVAKPVEREKPSIALKVPRPLAVRPKAAPKPDATRADDIPDTK